MIRAPRSNVKKNSPDKLRWTHQEPAESIVEERTLAEAKTRR